MKIPGFYSLPLMIIAILLCAAESKSQNGNLIDGKPAETDKCGFLLDDSDLKERLSPLYMGYGYDSLLIDLEFWRRSQYIKIDSIGLSVQGRPIWQLTISEDPTYVSGKRTVHIHARTHPQETEGFYVTDEILNILISESSLAQTARANCVFYIIPMYNPDGVVLGYPRRNANNIDLESNWNTFPHQPEVAALKARFEHLMSSQNPIEVMLNMHSSSDCKRYFVYHHENGTSAAYADLEQNFINGVRSYYPDGIAPFNFFVSWTSGTALQYPESWFWLNHGEKVMALTYEDKYRPSCPSSGSYDSTANAILRGVLDYMGILTGTSEPRVKGPDQFILYQNYPNPFNPSTIISWQIPSVADGKSDPGSLSQEEYLITLRVYDLLGGQVAELVNEYKPAGRYETRLNMNEHSLSSGVYYYRLSLVNGTDIFTETKKLIYLK